MLDPVQITAKGMEPDKLKNDFGDKIIFHGGIDTQHILPEGSREQVKQHCIDIMNTLGAKSGYIFAPTQILQLDIKIENIHIMYETTRKFNCVEANICP